jgi:hypothetical protein
MKTLKLVSAVCLAILLAAPTSVRAQNFRSPYGASRTSAGPSRSFLGLPIPQQWTGNRPDVTNQYSGSEAYRNNSNYGQNSAFGANGQYTSGQCATGNCPTRNIHNGRAATGSRTNAGFASGTCPDCNCPNGACASGLCASGQCATCANGECAGCTNGQCANGQCVSGSCPGGRCPVNQNSNVRYNAGPAYGAKGHWSPRTTRSNSADPFRQVEYQNENDNWTQRPALRNPVNDLYPSRYNKSDLDLRRPYFNNQSGELNDSRSGDRSSAARDIRTPRPSDRSMFGAPIDRAHGLAQI